VTVANTIRFDACLSCNINPCAHADSLFCVGCEDEFTGRIIAVDAAASDDVEESDDVKPEVDQDYEPGAEDDGPFDLDGYYECDCPDC